ncbi:transcriptional regulator [Paraburkholderia monticola]|uniref:Transcriptional regulator n=1 Tax=Paraburkholderia monticola TaxID=1399968 RepID=A0A149PY75_9BURK|nr:AlpA family phage regulatory protein [Paraburkholderia monticola]KXU89937.1 transcriptional regulator [Paraburkholderia monticola]
MAKQAIPTGFASDTGFPSPLSLPLDGLTTWNDLKLFLPFSRETARKLELAGQFPRRQRLTQRCTVYNNRELHRWFADPLNYRAQR